MQKILEKLFQYKMDRKTKSLLVATAVILLLSIYLINVSYSKPATQKSEIIYASLTQSGVYNYEAVLKPNSLYETGTLTRNQGNLFTSIVDILRFRYRYDIVSENESGGTVSYIMNAFLVSKSFRGKEEQILWQKKLPLYDSAELEFKSGNYSFAREYEINITEAINLSRTIEKETNVRGDTYIKLSTDVFVTSQTNGYPLEDKLQHVLMLDVGSTINSEGDAASANSTKKVSELIEEPVVTQVFGFDAKVSNARYLALITLAITLILVSFLGWRFLKNMPRVITSEADAINKKYKNLIIKTDSQAPEHDAVISVGSIEDLIRLSDDLAKPIIHSKNESTNVYYIMDGTMKYVFELRVNAPAISEKPEVAGS